MSIEQSSAGTEQQVKTIFKEHHATLTRLRTLAKKIQTHKRQRTRKLYDGDELELEQVISDRVDRHVGACHDPRVYMQQRHHPSKNLAISVLLDLSESTNLIINGGTNSLSQQIRNAVMLLGETLSMAGELFAISGFSSDGRKRVRIVNFKDYTESFTATRSRLTTIQGEHSTRMGAAVRYSESRLFQQAAGKKLLLVITDGAPSDIDVFDERYLKYDGRHAVQSLAQSGIEAFCLNLDRAAEETIQHIFGRGRSMSLQAVTQLPEVLAHIYFRYARH